MKAKNSSFLDGVVRDDDQKHLFPIEYLHDPLPASSPTQHPNALPFPSSLPLGSHFTTAHSIILTPQLGGLPYYSSIPHAYQSKYWRNALEASRTTVYLLSTDAAMADIPVRGGVTLRDIAKKELIDFEHKSMRATVYMYPFCVSKRRLEIIGLLNMLLFLFDDKFESAKDSEMASLITEFLDSLKPTPTSSPSTNTSKPAGTPQTSFQAYIASLIKSTHALDEQAGNTSGAEMFHEVAKLFDNIPSTSFDLTLSSYLAFRREQLYSSWVFAAVKFSLASSVNIHQPKIRNFMMWAAEHGALVNDLYSYEKEMIALKKGMIRDMVSAVPIVGRILGIEDEVECLRKVAEMVVEREGWMSEELRAWEEETVQGREGALDDETWMFLKAVWACVAGNTVFCMTSVRYGGEKARVC
ncbi:hypothetical protein K491DRAFT_762106 [Lophiostoma macrostomum CBS 122681]|uniref:Terpenoid synthase n=1 Tax=Lophiostoma macrostomum CBS 122681 TaxID=1314788 RepID=A0A6A6SUK0_9PLEO|nr:hypothetical protein K491DRAFT_762106 [Lophiostoma macrostomum CBS 122681]